MSFETNNYELAKQDRELVDQNLFMGKGELASILKKNNGKKSTRPGGDNQGVDDQNDIVEGEHRVDDAMLLEMCKFSNMSTANNVKKASGNGTIMRVNGANLQSQGQTKNVFEDIDVTLDGDNGTDGRPRVREVIILPPQYKDIDLNDPNAEILFQGELVKYKAGYTPTFISRWIQVTDSSLKYFKGRCNAITCCNNALMAIPIVAIKKVERVHFDLPMSKKEKEKHTQSIENLFEIHLKDDFIDIYLKPDYEHRINHCGHSPSTTERRSPSISPQKGVSPFIDAPVSVDSYKPSFLSTSSPRKPSFKPCSPGKIRGLDGTNHEMTQDEMKQRYMVVEEGHRISDLHDKITKSVNIQGSWSNREQEWYFTNKRLLFSTKSAEDSQQWVDKLNALVTEP